MILFMLFILNHLSKYIKVIYFFTNHTKHPHLYSIECPLSLTITKCFPDPLLF